MPFRAWFMALVAATLALSSPALAETRVALVIGNANYASVARLGNPISDAQTVASALRKVGFTTVTVQTDLGVTAMRQALQSFGALAASSDVALVYYAGHGMEAGGVNYLIPVDARLASARDIEFETVPLDLVLHAVEGAHRLKLVVLDACRNNPFAAQMQSDNRAIGRGLARVEPEGDTLVAYAAKAGTTADDGAAGNSPFATVFARDLAIPGLDIRLMLGKVRDDVLQATNHQQEPFVYGSLGGEAFYFVPPVGGPVTDAKYPAPQQTDPMAVELAFWNAVAESNDAGQIQSYLDKYPDGSFANLARAKLAALNKPPEVASPPPQNGPINVDAQTKLCRSLTSIDACTALINSGNLSAKELALAYNNRGVGYERMRQYDKALPDLDSALALNQDDPVIFANRGLAHDELHQPDLAIQDLNKAIELKPDYADAFVERGVAYALLGQYQRAMDDLDRSIALKPDFVNAYSRRAEVHLSLGQIDLAKQDIDKAIVLKPDNFDALTVRGTIYNLLGRYPEAMADLDRALTLKPDYVEAYSRRAEAHLLLGQADLALQDAEKEIALKPDNFDAFTVRGDIYGALGRYPEAMADFDHAIALKPDFVIALYYRCRYRAAQGADFDKAMSDCNEAIRIGPNDSRYRATLGYVQYRKQDYLAAIKEYDTALQLNPKDARAFYMRAVAKQKTGDATGFAADIASAKAIDPNVEKTLANIGMKF
jgi:tetratricopeptide (TPR) repeat protein